MSRIAVPIVSLFLISFFILAGSATTVTIGDIFSEGEVTVPIMINDVENAGAATIKVTYNPTVIIVTDITKGDFGSFMPNPYYAEEGWVKIAAWQVGEGSVLSGNKKFAVLTISPRGSYGEISDLELDLEQLADYSDEYNDIEADVIDGFFYIGMNGDVTADRTVDTADSEYIAKGIAGIAGYELKEGASEVNGDGIVDAYDCVYLARYAAGISGYEELK
jgi:hypothetical protein